MSLDTSNLHSRPWEKLPEAVLNLLALHSLYAYYLGGPLQDRTPPCWCVRKLGETKVIAFVAIDCPLEHWVTHVESATRMLNTK